MCPQNLHSITQNQRLNTQKCFFSSAISSRPNVNFPLTRKNYRWRKKSSESENKNCSEISEQIVTTWNHVEPDTFCKPWNP